MKRIFFFYLFLFYLSLNAQLLSDNGITLISQNSIGIELNLSVGDIGFQKNYYNDKVYDQIITSGIFLPSMEGSPNFPSYSRIVAIPQNSYAKIEIVEYKKTTYNNILPLPAKKIPLESESQINEYNEDSEIYNSSEIYPENIIEISNPWKIRGVDVVIFGITPFQWNPVTKELVVYSDIKVRIDFIGGNGIFGEDRLRSRYWDDILKENLINYNSLPIIDYQKRVEIQTFAKNRGAEFVIIIPDDPEFSFWADSIKRFRNEMGIITEVYSLSDIGGTSAQTIENWIDNAYYNWFIPPEAILLLSDYPTSGENYGITSHLLSHPGGGYFVSDNKYASVENDSLPDIVIGRITAQNSDQLRNIIFKNFEYERNPPIDNYFYDHPISALAFQNIMWYQVCGEVIRGFFVNFLGKDAIRIYNTYDNPSQGAVWSMAQNTSLVVNYFNAYNYIDTVIPGGINWNGGTQGLIDAINLGAFIVQYRSHGRYDKWQKPLFSNQDLDALTNSYGRKWPFVFSTTCLTGEFNSGSESFVEKFHRLENSGALGLNAATGESHAFVNDIYVWGIYDFMWSYFDRGYGDQQNITNAIPAFAMVSGKYYLSVSSWNIYPGLNRLTSNLFHHFGDPYMRLYTKLPQGLNVNHNGEVTAGQRYFTISADVQSFICLSVMGEIIGRGEATGFTQNIPIIKQNLGTQVKLMITKQDCYAHEELLDVVLANGTLVGFAVLDSVIGGHNNGQINVSQSYDLYIAVANWGTEIAYNVKGLLYSNDPNISVVLDTIIYETILSNDTSHVPYPFHITIADSIEDYYSIPLILETWDSSDSLWIDTFYLTVNSPKVKTSGIYGPDIILSGDTLSLGAKLFNNGSGTAFTVDMKLWTVDPYINIIDSTEYINSLNPQDSILKRNAFVINVDYSTPQPYFVDMFLKVELEGQCFYIDTFTLGLGSAIFSEDFEDKDTADWTFSVDTGQISWHITSKDAYNSTRSMFCGTLMGSYPRYVWNAKAISPEFSVSDGVKLSFWHKYYTEQNYDAVQLKFTTDNGNSWNVIFTEQGYNSTKRNTNGGFYNGESIWSGNHLSNWVEHTYIFNYNGTIKLAWKFGSDRYTEHEGYYFDDILIGPESNIGIEEESYENLNNNYYLAKLYPNLVNGKVMISYGVGQDSYVKLIIYDISGRQVASLVNSYQSAGNYKVEWNGRDNRDLLVRSGVYFYMLEAGTFIDINKFLIVR